MNLQHLAITRRNLLKILGAGAVVASTSASTSPITKVGQIKKAMKHSFSDLPDQLITQDGADFNPIDRTVPLTAPQVYSGDNPERAHAILRHKDAYIRSKGGIPKPTESAKVVIVGGGLSGILSGYLLRDLKPVILERGVRFGGNARAESYLGTDYSIGSDYLAQPTAGSELEKLLKELDVASFSRVVESSESVAFQGKVISRFWEGATDPSKKSQFTKLAAYFSNVMNSDNGEVYPEIPANDPSARETVNELDGLSFRAHLEKKMGGPLHPHIQTILEYYCSSALCAPFSTVSAAAGLNFFASEFGPLWAPKGGNAAIAERALMKLKASTPANSLRPNSIVVSVSVQPDGVNVTYANPNDDLVTIQAQSVIMSCPKFIVKLILNEIEPERERAIEKLQYHAYLVATVVLDQKLSEKNYDIPLLANGTSELEKKATDIVFVSYPTASSPVSILTLYRAFTDDSGREQIFAPDSFEKFKKLFSDQIEKEVLALFGLKKENVKDLRLARWGHPLPVAQAGLFADGTVDLLRKPFQNKVFFVEQDNWAVPCFEICASEALTFTKEVRKTVI